MQQQIKYIIFILLGLLFSCTLFRPKCPIPNCKIRQEHRHALTFSDEVRNGSWSLEKQGERWMSDNDTTQTAGEEDGSTASSDTSSTDHTDKLSKAEKKRQRKLEKEMAKAERKRKKKEIELTDEEKLAMEEQMYADDSEYRSSDTDALSDEELEEQEKIADEEAKAAEKAGKQEGDDLLKYWRSRITEWWRKNQKPKIGEYWKKPKQN